MESKSIKENLEIILGFLERPKNQIILGPKFLPNKAGGDPAWISEASTPSLICEHCGYKLSFLLQIAANINEEDPNYQRMLYVFVCLSPQCISAQSGVRVFRGYAEDKGQFADGEEFDLYYDHTEDELIIKGVIQSNYDHGYHEGEEEKEIESEELEQEEEEEDIKVKGFKFQQFLIETDVEQYNVTQFYLKESQRLKNQTDKSAKQQDDDEDEDLTIEDAFLSQQATSKKMKNHIEKLTKEAQNEEEDEADDDNEKQDKVEMKELEKMIENKHVNYSKISQQYKLFEYIAKQNLDQTVRYLKQRVSGVEPLWLSEKNIIQSVPNCKRCGSQRVFEFQIMPQIFDRIQELLLVDWNTIVVYTCSNPSCMPDIKSGQYYVEEFSYIQFSDDFAQVQYGDDEQIKKQQQQKKQELQKIEESEKEQNEQDAKERGVEEEEKKQKKKKNKNKKKSKAEEDKNTKDEVNNEVQSQLKDLMENFSLNQ